MDANHVFKIYICFGFIYFLISTYKLIADVFFNKGDKLEQEEQEAKDDMVEANTRLKNITGGHFVILITVGSILVFSCKYFITWPIDLYHDIKG